jgi:hypothetical protein
VKPVIQEEKTGCAIACAAAIAGKTYQETRKIANGMGIYANDSDMWSKTNLVRKLLAELRIKTASRKKPFVTWESLPNCALLSIKWHLESGKPFWHWVIFVREKGREYVVDSKKSLTSNIRTDFGRMKPKWYIKINA